jgi:hypothetical protein
MPLVDSAEVFEQVDVRVTVDFSRRDLTIDKSYKQSASLHYSALPPRTVRALSTCPLPTVPKPHGTWPPAEAFRNTVSTEPISVRFGWAGLGWASCLGVRVNHPCLSDHSTVLHTSPHTSTDMGLLRQSRHPTTVTAFRDAYPDASQTPSHWPGRQSDGSLQKQLLKS